MNYQFIETPIGELRLVSNGRHLVQIDFPGTTETASDDVEQGDVVLTAAAGQLREYFAGKRRAFDLPLDTGGTEFQRQVWTALTEIPFGELRSYSDIASSIGRPKAVRAVGAANGRNPIPIVVPCHRVIGSDGSLTGFAGGLELKTRLLQLENAL